MTVTDHYTLHRVSAAQAMADRILLGVPTAHDPSDGSWWSARPRALDTGRRIAPILSLPLDFARREALALIGSASDPGRAEQP